MKMILKQHSNYAIRVSGRGWVARSPHATPYDIRSAFTVVKDINDADVMCGPGYMAKVLHNFYRATSFDGGGYDTEIVEVEQTTRTTFTVREKCS